MKRLIRLLALTLCLALLCVVVVVPETEAATYVSASEITRAASAYGIGAGTTAYAALQSIESVYGSQLTASQRSGVVVFLFEGVGNNASASARMNAMCVVVKNGSIAYLNRNSSTIPDYPFNPAKNSGTNMPTLKAGIYTFSTVNHNGSYAALNVNGAQVVRFASKTSYADGTSAGINVHRRSTDSIAASSATRASIASISGPSSFMATGII